MEDQPHIQKRVWAVVGIACAATLTGILSASMASRAYISPGEFMEAFGGVGAASSEESSQASSMSTPPIPSLFDAAAGTPPIPSLFHPSAGALPIPSLSDVMANTPPIPSLAEMNTSSASVKTNGGGSRTIINPLYPAYRSHFGQAVSPALRTINPVGTIAASSSSRVQVTIQQNVVPPQTGSVTASAPQDMSTSPGSHALIALTPSSSSSVLLEVRQTADTGTPFPDFPARTSLAGTAQPIGSETVTAMQGVERRVLAQVIPPAMQPTAPAGMASPLSKSGASPMLLALIAFFGILGARLVRTRRQDVSPSL